MSTIDDLTNKNTKLDEFRSKLNELNEIQLSELLIKICSSYEVTLPIIKMIVEAGANPRYKNDQAFINSGCARNPDITKYFLTECDVDVNAQNGEALVEACGSHYWMVTRILLDHDVKITDKAIQMATEWHSDENVIMLLKHGVDPNLIFEKALRTVINKDNWISRIFGIVNKYSDQIDYESVVLKVCKDAL